MWHPHPIHRDMPTHANADACRLIPAEATGRGRNICGLRTLTPKCPRPHISDPSLFQIHFYVGVCLLLSCIMWRMVLKSSLLTVPVTVAVLDVFGYVARVEGASMQVSLFAVKYSQFLLYASAALPYTRLRRYTTFCLPSGVVSAYLSCLTVNVNISKALLTIAWRYVLYAWLPTSRFSTARDNYLLISFLTSVLPFPCSLFNDCTDERHANVLDNYIDDIIQACLTAALCSIPTTGVPGRLWPTSNNT